MLNLTLSDKVKVNFAYILVEKTEVNLVNIMILINNYIASMYIELEYRPWLTLLI